MEIEFKNTHLSALLNHWIEAKGGRPVPYRSDINPMAFPKVLPYAWIYRLDDDDEFHCKLAGEEVENAYQRPMIGQSGAELLGQDYSWVRERWLYLMRKPAFLYVFQQRPADEGKIFERVILPVADDNGEIRQVLGAATYVSRNAVPLIAPTPLTESGALFDAKTLEPLPYDELPAP